MNDLAQHNVTLEPPQIIDLRLRKVVQNIEETMRNIDGVLGEDPFPLKHSFAHGLYIREVFMPKDHLIVGKLHRDSYFNSIIRGDVSILTEEGIKRVKGPASLISPAGTKRFGRTHEDTVWVTVHANPDNITDIDVLEDMIHIKDFCEVRGCVIKDGIEIDFNVKEFRALTKEIFAHEKTGFWSDWTEEQQKIYMSGDWEAFSGSRGYTASEIDTLRQWIKMKERGESLGLDPLNMILDLSMEVSMKNIKADKRGEILKSSHMPSSTKQPYKEVI
jgi:hypothetical protein